MPNKRKRTRLEYYQAQGSALVELPAVDGFEHVLNALFDVGPVKAGFNSREALGYTDIVAYMSATKTDLTGHECRMIRRMSRAYADQLVDSKDPNCPPPYAVAVATPEQRTKVDDGFRALAARRRKK